MSIHTAMVNTCNRCKVFSSHALTCEHITHREIHLIYIGRLKSFPFYHVGEKKKHNFISYTFFSSVPIKEKWYNLSCFFMHMWNDWFFIRWLKWIDMQQKNTVFSLIKSFETARIFFSLPKKGIFVNMTTFIRRTDIAQPGA